MSVIADTVLVSVTPTLDTSIFADKDLMHATVMEFTGMARRAGGSGTITRATLVDASDQGLLTDLWLLTASPTNSTLTANGALVIHDTDLLTVVDVIAFPAASYSDANTGQVCTVRNPNITYQCAAGSTSLYGLLVSRGTGTYGAAGLTVKLNATRDL